MYYVYILTHKRNGVLYIGVTNNLKRRFSEHKNKIHKGFTQQYNINRLVYYEEFDDIIKAIHREKQLKKWKRTWKIQLIEKKNLQWIELDI